MTHFLKENLAILAAALVVSFTGPAISYAQTETVNPLPFDEARSVSRGSVSPRNPNASHISDADACSIAMQSWGWSHCDDLDLMAFDVVPGADTTVFFAANSGGLVRFDDWNSQDRDRSIREIEASLREGMRAQGAAIGQEIEFVGWRTYPTLDQENHYLYYAIDSRWNGEPVTNIKATVFDRRGYVEVSIVPYSVAMTDAQVREMVLGVLDSYTPAPSESYAAFQSGDKVAAVGALGVLAGMVGVKYTKTAAVGLAVVLAMAKKLIALVILPFLWLGRLFRRKRPA